jgi:hypothetical protein
MIGLLSKYLCYLGMSLGYVQELFFNLGNCQQTHFLLHFNAQLKRCKNGLYLSYICTIQALIATLIN